MTWPSVALGQVAEINPREATRPADSEEIAFVPMAELDATRATTSRGSVRAFAEVSKGYTIFHDADVLVAKITPCFENNKIGQAHLSRPTGVGSTEFHVVRPRNSALDPRYVLHFLRQDGIRAQGERRMTGSAGQRRVPAAFLAGLEVPLPPLAEQRRIAAILDKADALRAMREQAVVLSKEAIESLLGGVSRDAPRVRTTLIQAGVDFETGKNIVGTSSNEHTTNRVIKVSAVSRGQFDPREVKPLPANYSPPASHEIRSGDILFGRASGSLDLLGATVRVRQVSRNLYLPDKVWRAKITPSALITPEYLLGLLQSAPFRSYIRHRASGAAGVRNIGKAAVLSYQFDLPELSVQLEYARKRNSLMRHLDAQREQSTGIANLFASLQSRAFTGEL